MWSEGHVAMEEESEMQHFWLWGWKGPQAKECGYPLETGKGKEMDSPLEFKEEHSSADTLILAQGD